MSEPIERVLEALRATTGTDPEQAGETQWECRCPAHEDNRASLGVSVGDDGKVLLCCQAGCTFGDVVSSLGLTPGDLFPPKPSTNGRSRIVATYDYKAEDGTLLFQVCRFTPKDFRQRKPEGDGWNWSIKGVRRVLYRLPELTAADTSDVVLIVEGEKDVHAAESLGFLATCCSAGAGKWRSEYSETLTGRNVVVIPDDDKPGRDHAAQVVKSLGSKAARVRVVTLPKAKDLAEWVERGGTAEKLAELLAESPAGKGGISAASDTIPTPEDPPGDRPPVFVTFDEAATARETIAGLGTGIYQRAGELVHIVTDATPCRSVNVPEGTLRIRPLAAPVLRERITERVDLLRATGKEPERVRPPGWLVAAIHQRGEWPPESIPPLAGIVRSPTLRPDYSVLQTPGYDRPTGLFYQPDGEFPTVPESPSLEDARRAAAELLECVCDFPFLQADGEDHRTVWLSYGLTLAGRPAIAGPVPLFCFDAPAAGSGKSLLVDVANIVVFGDVAARYSWSGDDAELRKTITAVACEALPAVLLDNLDGDIRSAALDAALTGTTWRDRVLGKSETTGVLPLTTVWAATGNNVGLQGDTARRALFCRLEPDSDDPEERTDFRHADLTGWTRDNRHRLAVAAVTILRAYAAAGRPQVKLPPWGSYESWSSLVRQAVVWLGFTDPAATRRLARAADRTRELHRLLLDGIEEADDGEGLTSAEIVKRAEDATIYPVLAEAVAEICGAKPDARKLGNKLRRYRGRRHEGRQLVSETGCNNTQRWRVSRFSQGTQGTRGTSPIAGTFSESVCTVSEASEEQKSERLETLPLVPESPEPYRERGVL